MQQLTRLPVSLNPQKKSLSLRAFQNGASNTRKITSASLPMTMNATDSTNSTGLDENGLIPYGQPGYFQQPFIYCDPPPGITPDFNSPNPNGILYIVLSIIGLLLATLFASMRLYTKCILTRSPGWDDCMCACLLLLTRFKCSLKLILLARYMRVMPGATLYFLFAPHQNLRYPPCRYDF